VLAADDEAVPVAGVVDGVWGPQALRPIVISALRASRRKLDFMAVSLRRMFKVCVLFMTAG
jgi:hypothetical protein